MVAYSYPPVGGIGVQRTLKFTKYLSQFGFTPFVLTVRDRSTGTLDTTLLEEVPDEAEVVATASAERRLLSLAGLLRLNSELFVPDVHIGWLPFAVRSGAALIRKNDIDVIFATAPVFTSLLVGYALKKKTRKPLVLDFRDPWTQNVFTTRRYTRMERLHAGLEERMERAVLRMADHVVTTTDEMSQALITKHPFIQGRCATIRNGFDAADFHGLTRSSSSERFTITYAGSLYGPRTGAQFMAALGNLLGRHRDLRGQIRVVFIGHPDKRTMALVHELHLDDVVEMKGFVSHRESVQTMINADVLLLVMSQREVTSNGARPMTIPAKTFEYLATRRPILTLAPQSAMTDLITTTGSGMVVSPEDVDAIEAAILNLFGRWQAGTLSVTPCDLSAFERKALTGRLATILESVCRNGGGEGLD
jgi:glycosyltransferase involved in cell wall biosynthesis